MRPPLAALRPFVIAETARARADQAAALYHPDRVVGLILAAAQAGLDSVRIAQETPAPLHETPAAAALAVWARDKKFRLIWEPRSLVLPDGRTGLVQEPHVGWDT